MRTITSTVTFRRPFVLPGFDAPHAPGTFDVQSDEERLDTVFEGWHRVMTTILLRSPGRVEAWPVDPADLAKAIATDAAPEPAKS
jgi:hypothetical protein